MNTTTLKTPSIKELQKELTRLKSHIDDDTVNEMDDEPIPQMEITLACGYDGYALQTGDNSYSGSAYSFPHWGVSYLYQSSNCTELAKELIDQCKDLANDYGMATIH